MAHLLLFEVAMNDWILNVYNVNVSRMNECNNNNVRSDKKESEIWQID